MNTLIPKVAKESTRSMSVEIQHLLDSVANPIESHVNCFGCALFYSFIGDACSAGVLCLSMGSWLWMPHFNEIGAEGNIFTCVVE
jgi:hypothetical protein